MKTGNMAIHLTHDGHLFDVQAGVQADTALELAGDLAEGVSQLLERLYDDVNDGALVYCGELKALELVAEMSSALVRSVNWNMKQEKNNDN